MATVLTRVKTALELFTTDSLTGVNFRKRWTALDRALVTTTAQSSLAYVVTSDFAGNILSEQKKEKKR
jgi:hypothetical protein